MSAKSKKKGSLPAEFAFVGEFDKTRMTSQFSLARLENLGWGKLSLIASAYGWKIHVGKAAFELADRKRLLDFGRRSGAATRIAAMENNALKAMASRAGLSMKYGNRAIRNRMVMEWVEASQRKFSEFVAQSRWMGPAIKAMKAGQPIELDMAVATGLCDIARNQFGYERKGEQLIKCDVYRWTVYGRMVSRSELEQMVMESVKTRDQFEAQTGALRVEFEALLEKNNGIEVDKDAVQVLVDYERQVSYWKKSGNKNTAGIVDRVELDRNAAIVKIGDSIGRLGLESAERLAFLGNGFFGRRADLLEKMNANVALLKTKLQSPPDAIAEPKYHDRDGQMFLI